MSDFQKRLRELERIETDERHAALEAISARYRPQRKALQTECGERGHNWKFNGLGIFRHIHWHICTVCGATKSTNTEPETSP